MKIQDLIWDEVLDYEAVKTELLLESARNNTSHGDRLTPADKKRIARDIASSDPKTRYTETALAEKLGVTQQTVNAWITDIRARQKTNRDSIIIRLSRLGWTQEKIARTTQMTQGRVAKIINNYYRQLRSNQTNLSNQLPAFQRKEGTLP